MSADSRDHSFKRTQPSDLKPVQSLFLTGKGEYVFLTVWGNILAPRIEHGDLILVQLQPDQMIPQIGDMVATENSEGEIRLCSVKKSGGPVPFVLEPITGENDLVDAGQIIGTVEGIFKDTLGKPNIEWAAGATLKL